MRKFQSRAQKGPPWGWRAARLVLNELGGAGAGHLAALGDGARGFQVGWEERHQALAGVATGLAGGRRLARKQGPRQTMWRHRFITVIITESPARFRIISHESFVRCITDADTTVCQKVSLISFERPPLYSVVGSLTTPTYMHRDGSQTVFQTRQNFNFLSFAGLTVLPGPSLSLTLRA